MLIMGAYEDMLEGTNPPKAKGFVPFEGVSDDQLEQMKAQQQPEDESLLSKAMKVYTENPVLKDINDTAGNYITGAVQGAKELNRAINQYQDTNPYENFSYSSSGELPAETPEQQAAREYKNQAESNFAKETVAPAALTVFGILTPTPAIVAGTAYSLGEGYSKTGTVGGALREATYGPLADWWNQDNLGEQFLQRPVSTSIEGILGLGQAGLPFLGAFKGYKTAKGLFGKEETGLPPGLDNLDPSPEVQEFFADLNRESNASGDVIQQIKNARAAAEEEGLKAATVREEPINVEDLANKEPWEMTKEEWDKSTEIKLPQDATPDDYMDLAGTAAREGNFREAAMLADKADNTTFAAVFRKLGEKQPDEHKAIVEDALQENKPVPSKVINEYPDLVSKYPEAVKAATTAESQLTEGIQGSLGSNTKPAPTTYNKPVTKAEIINDINKLVITREGKVGNRNYQGIYKTMPEVIRSRNYGDFDTYAHEIGHYIDQKLGIKGYDNELISAADKEWGSNKLYQKYTPEQKRAEGIAEFGRQYLLNPEEAQKNFPGYYKEFADKLTANKDIADSLNNIGDKMRAWYSQSPEARGRGGVTFGNETDYRTNFEKVTDKGSKLYDQMIDRHYPLHRLSTAIQEEIGRKLAFEEDPYKLARSAQNSSVSRAEMMLKSKSPGLTQEILNELYHGKIDHAVTLEQIFKKIDPKKLSEAYPDYLKNGNFKDWHEALSTLLTAKRQVELQGIKPKYKGPMSPEDAATIIKNAPKELEAATKKIYQYSDNLLSVLEDGGIISKEALNTLRNKYSNYVPMMRDFSDEEAMGRIMGARGKGFGNVSSPIKALEEGSPRPVIDPLENLVKNTYMVFDLVERNRVAKAFVDLSKEPGVGKFIEKVPGGASDSTKSIFTVMVDGKKEAYQTLPEFYGAITSYGEPLSFPFSSIFTTAAHALRVGATSSPAFMLRNMMKDTITAALYTRTGMKPVLGSIEGMWKLATDKKLRAEFQAAGVPISTRVGLDRISIKDELTKMAKGDDTWSKINPVNLAKLIYEGARTASEFVESGTRMGEFARAREMGMSIDEAGLAGKDVTLDFSRSGSLGQKANQMIPFFNATLQGGDRLIRQFSPETALRSLAAATAYITIPSIGLWLINHQQEWYKQLSDDEKNGAWFIDTGHGILKIPKPFEPGIFFGSAYERALDFAAKQDPHVFKKWATYAKDQFLPNFFPAIATPIVQWLANYNFYTEKPVVNRREQDLPDEKQYNAYTTEIAKKMGMATGLSPEKIDMAINGYFGSAGKFIAGVGDYIIPGHTMMPAKGLTEQPGISSFFRQPMANPQSVQDFYDNLDKIEKDYNATGKKGNPPANVRNMRQYSKQIAELNKDNRNITTNNNISPEEKRSKIDANNAKILSIAKKANDKYPPQ